MALVQSPLRIAVVQFFPKIGQVQANLAKARDLCRTLKRGSVDLVCLPEMIFTGYVFENASSISPHLELPRTGPTSRFCAELADRLGCYVVAGYPERLQQQEAEQTDGKDGSNASRFRIGANSAILCRPNGEWVGHYRKTNLFETDQTWARQGNGFATFHLPPPLGTMALGICMDLNAQPPANWTLAEGPYELADHCVSEKANLLILLNAWLDSGEEPEEEYDWKTLSFWAARLRPLWAKPEPSSDTKGSNLPEGTQVKIHPNDSNDETIVIVCNRCGEENGRIFAGSSAIFSMRRGSDQPKLLDMMGRHEEGVRVWEILV